jgi:hypothetical protein
MNRKIIPLFKNVVYLIWAKEGVVDVRVKRSPANVGIHTSYKGKITFRSMQ